MRIALINQYKENRKHQLKTYGNSNWFYNGVDMRRFTGGSAAYGFHAIAAYLSAKSHLHFMKHIKGKF